MDYLYGSGDAVIGVNPASDNPDVVRQLLVLMDEVRQRFEIPIQTCVLEPRFNNGAAR